MCALDMAIAVGQGQPGDDGGQVLAQAADEGVQRGEVGALDHSSGRVEGAVNKITMLKRQMYGRAGFDLLRTRVLHAR